MSSDDAVGAHQPEKTQPHETPAREARARLAREMRRLIEATVATDAGEDEYSACADEVAALADRLHAFATADDNRPRIRLLREPVDTSGEFDLAAVMPFDVIVGSCNPMAPPLSIELVPPKAFARGTFSPSYEGGPGLVHGAALAGAFDIVLTAANVVAQGAGPTVELTIRYRKPTRLNVPCLFEAWVVEKTDRRIFSRGHLVQDGVITVEAEGEFVNKIPGRFQAAGLESP